MKISREPKYLAISPLCALCVFIGAVTTHAATYYVATTGSDSNAGTSVGSPFRNIQKCIDSMVAGDTCTVANGTYTVANGTNGNIVGYVRTTNAAGTAASPITIKSTNQYGAIVTLPTTAGGSNGGFHIRKNYWIIDGFDIQGPGGASGSTGENYGIGAYATGVIIRNNKLHNIATGDCTSTRLGSNGIYVQGMTNLTIEKNIFYTIGRLLQGENGCTVDSHNHDHGIYIGTYDGGSDITIQNNLFYDITRGWPIQAYGSTGGSISNVNIYNNTFADKNPTFNRGQIGLFTVMSNVNIKNNICYDPLVGCVNVVDTPQYALTNVLVDHNLSTNTINAGTRVGVTFTNNLGNQTASSLFTNPVTRDYTLKAGSPGIDAGVNVGLPFNGAVPDMGAYELSQQAGDTAPPLPPVGLSVK